MKILLLAGEESGLIYANALASRLAAHEVRGYADYGFRTADLAVVGIWAVLRRIGYFLRVARTMKRAIGDWRPDVVLTIDYPGMNLKLAAYAKARGIRAVHVVCPQVWAWKQGRIPKIEAALDALCCFFPFEPKLFRDGFATFVGHPLVGDFAKTREGLKRREGEGRETGGARLEAGETGDARRMVALLPGSRKGEIARNLPPLLEAAKLLAKAHPEVRFAIPAVHPAAEAQIRAIIAQRRCGILPHQKGIACGILPHPSVEVRLGGAREVLLTATCAAVASGTATLEAALARCPTVLVYRVSAALAWLARRVIKGTRFLGLANILWDRCGRMPHQRVGTDPQNPGTDPKNRGTDPQNPGTDPKNRGTDPEPPMPELLQEDFTPAAVAARLGRWLDDSAARGEAVRRLTAATDLLVAEGDPVSRILRVAGILV